MERNREVRLDPSRLLPGAKSILSFALAYRHERPMPPENERTGRISCYAWGRDYHRVLEKKLKKIKQKILSANPEASVYYEVDTGPVLERYWAERSGIGWIGKNSNLIVHGLGSFVFLAALVTDLEYIYSHSADPKCGNCEACMKACPTGAILEPGVIDCNRCISYSTIEHRGEIPEEIRERTSPWVFGCDTCQEVCPWNQDAPLSVEPDFAPRPGLANPSLEWLMHLSPEDFEKHFQGTPARRAGIEGLRRNAEILLRNMPDD
jgi:epoxyqueuosine reductase